MIIPKYVEELMSRSAFVIGGYDPGYTIAIEKKSDYSYVSTLMKEIKRLRNWVYKSGKYPEDFDAPPIVINKIPKQTFHHKQYAVVTIYDPLMKYLENYINRKNIYIEEVNI